MGSFESWSYGVLWVPGPQASFGSLVAQRQGARRQEWLHVALPAAVDTPRVPDVLEEVYAATLALMECLAARG